MNAEIDGNHSVFLYGELLYGSGQLGSPGDPTSASRFIRGSMVYYPGSALNIVHDSLELRIYAVGR